MRAKCLCAMVYTRSPMNEGGATHGPVGEGRWEDKEGG